MLLKNMIDLSKDINEYREDMYELVKNKNFSDPDVVKISEQLDGKIIMMQKIIYTACSSQKKLSHR